MDREGQLAAPRGRRWPFRRFVVQGASMEPTLVTGQGVVGVRSHRVRPGELRVVEHPFRPGFWLVKRVDAVSGETMIVRSDNVDAEGAIDSTTFGPVDAAGSYRVLVRIPRRWMSSSG